MLILIASARVRIYIAYTDGRVLLSTVGARGPLPRKPESGAGGDARKRA